MEMLFPEGLHTIRLEVLSSIANGEVEIGDPTQRYFRLPLHGCDYADCALADIEADIVIGTYWLPPTNNKKASWWPSPNVFDSSCFNVGWWLPVAEEWYQSNKRSYLGQAQATDARGARHTQPRRPAQWRSEIANRDKRVKLVQFAVLDYSLQYLRRRERLHEAGGAT